MVTPLEYELKYMSKYAVIIREYLNKNMNSVSSYAIFYQSIGNANISRIPKVR